MALSDAPQCTAKAKTTGQRCKNPAVQGSDKCRMHGGKGSGRPIVHGRYSKKYRQTLVDKVEVFEEFRGDLAPEIDLLRGLLQNFLDKLSASQRVGAREIDVVAGLVDTIARTEERYMKIRKETAFGAQELLLMQKQMAAVFQKYVPADQLPDALDDLRRLLADN